MADGQHLIDTAHRHKPHVILDDLIDFGETAMFPCGMMTVFMPFLYAAMDFSRRPPMGSTRPAA